MTATTDQINPRPAVPRCLKALADRRSPLMITLRSGAEFHVTELISVWREDDGSLWVSATPGPADYVVTIRVADISATCPPRGWVMRRSERRAVA